MNRGDESDEEVTLSEPDTDDTQSIEDYEHSNDNDLDTGHAAPEPEPQDEIDYALHDAEVQRAAERPDSAPPKPVIPAARSNLSAAAEPWVPSGYSTTSQAPMYDGEVAHQAPTDFQPVSDPPVRNQDGEQERSHKDDGEGAPHANGRKQTELPTSLPVLVDGAEGQSEQGNPEAQVSSREENTDKPSAKDKQTQAAKDPEDPHRQGRAATGNTGDSAPIATGEAEAVQAVEAAKTPDQETKALASQLPAPEAASSEPQQVAASHQSSEAQPSTLELKEGEAIEENGIREKVGQEESKGQSTDQNETKELASELPSSAAAQPPPTQLNEDTRGADTPMTETSLGKENVEPSGEARSPSSSLGDLSNRSNAGPSLPPRSASASGPKGLGRGLGPSGPSKGMPSLPARPARRASQSVPQEEQRSTSEQTPRSQDDTQPSGPQPDTSSAPVTQRSSESGQQPAPSNGGNEERRIQPRGLGATQPAPSTQSTSAPETPPESDQVKKVRAKLRDLRVQLFRLASRLGYSDHNLVKTIKYRLDHAERVRLDRTAAQEDLLEVAKNLEGQNSEEVIYDVTVMVIGISGTGKSALINNLLGYEAVSADPFEGTKQVQEVTSTRFGLKLRVIDTPGLLAAADASSYNTKVLGKIDKARRKYKPDLIIYTERMDMLRRDLSDLPILRRITETLGSEVWFNTLIVITHGTATLMSPRGDVFQFDQLSQTRAAMFQRALQATVGDARVNVPTAFAENSPTCPTNDEGEPILPNGLAWRRFILIYLAAIKVLREADNELQATSKKQENQAMSQLSMLLQAQRGVKLPPLPFLITNMIKHAGPKQYPQGEQDIKREDEIKSIKRFGLRRKEFRKRTTFLKGKQAERRMIALGKESDEPEIDPYEPPNQGPALSPTFDSDDNALFYRAYEPRAGEGGWLTRPRLEQNVTDHTDGVESLTTERSFVKRGNGQDLDGIPSSVHAIIQKDKCNQLFQGGAEASYYQNYRIVHTARGQVMTLSGGDMLYISQLETLLRYIPRNNLTLGAMVSRLSEEDQILPLKGKVALGMKLEDEFELPESRRYNLKNSIKAGIGRGTINLGQGRKEQATGMNAEWQLVGGTRENVQVMGSFSRMDYRGNKGKQYALSANIPVTEETTISPKIQLQGNQGSLSLRCASYDHSNVGLVVFLPLAKALWDKIQGRNNDNQLIVA